MFERPLGTDLGALSSYVARAGRGGAIAWLDGNDGSPRGRYSFLGVSPVETLVARADDPDPLAIFDRLEADACADRAGHVLGGQLRSGLPHAHVPRWIGAISYDLAWSIPETLGLRRAPAHARGHAPVAFFHRYDALLVADAVTGQLALVGEDEPAVARLDRVLGSERLASARAHAAVSSLVVEPREVHARAIERALGLVRDGIVYQVNLARRWSASIEGLAPTRALATAASATSPVPYGAYLELGALGAELALSSRSMERFLRWDRARGTLESRPIKGTIARTPASSDEARRELLADPKERAEHAMIVDLMRNDLGRVAEIGSVEVADAFAVEPYRHLHHLVSTVRARSRPEVTLRDVIVATFPPGSVTGTPKLSAIEHIEALERAPRGFYCGAIGHVDRGGGLDLSVAIRTAQVRGDVLEYFGGGGIVDASEVGRELDETELKARALLDALAALERAR